MNSGWYSIYMTFWFNAGFFHWLKYRNAWHGFGILALGIVLGFFLSDMVEWLKKYKLF